MQASEYRHHLYNDGHISKTWLESDFLQRRLCRVEQWLQGSWVGHSQEPGEQLFSSSNAQRKIWEHQHPEDCASQNFLLYAGDNSVGHGIGSTLHLATWALAEAMSAGRILLFAATPDGIWTRGEFCDGYKTFYECYFEPVSSCTLNDLLQNQSISEIPVLQPGGEQQHLQLVRVLMGSFEASRTRLIPPQVEPLLRSTFVAPSKRYFWWRAQGVAYILRPNPRTLQEIAARKAKSFARQIPFGTISVHIRHGDKAREMVLVPDEVYLRKAEELLAAFPELTRTIFLSTEDSESVKFFRQVSNWTVLLVDTPRQTKVMSPADFANDIGADEEVLNSLTNLDLALDCSAWVGTLGSNWNRLIEELRSTVRCKAHLPYLDAHQGWEIENYDWR